MERPTNTIMEERKAKHDEASEMARWSIQSGLSTHGRNHQGYTDVSKEILTLLHIGILKRVRLSETLRQALEIKQLLMVAISWIEFVQFVISDSSPETYLKNPNLEAGTITFPERAKTIAHFLAATVSAESVLHLLFPRDLAKRSIQGLLRLGFCRAIPEGLRGIKRAKAYQVAINALDTIEENLFVGCDLLEYINFASTLKKIERKSFCWLFILVAYKSSPKY
eukprot:scaffold11647_cov55-Cylindrotheca_fusiformis.AAC.2